MANGGYPSNDPDPWKGWKKQAKAGTVGWTDPEGKWWTESQLGGWYGAPGEKYGGRTGTSGTKPPSEGERRAHRKYGLGPGGLPGSMEWWLDEYQKGIGNQPMWGDYGTQSRQMGDKMRQWAIQGMGLGMGMRGTQQEALGMLGRRARGEDLISRQLMQQQAGRIAAQGQSLAAGAPGGYNPMAQRLASQQAAGAQQQLAGQAAVAGAQEIQAAQDALLRGAGGVRAQDQARQRLLQQMVAADRAREQLDLSRYGIDVQRHLQNLQHKKDLIGLSMDEWQQYRALQAAIAAENKPWYEKLLPAMIGAGGSALAAYLGSRGGGGGSSDIRAKTNIAGGGGDVDQMFNQLTPYSYDYRNPGAPGARPGRQLGVMAQDLERSPMGSSLVMNTPQGKMVDYQAAAPMMMAGLARQNQRLNQLEMGGGETRPRGQVSATPIPLPSPSQFPMSQGDEAGYDIGPTGRVSATPIPLPSPSLSDKAAKTKIKEAKQETQAVLDVLTKTAGVAPTKAERIRYKEGAGGKKIPKVPTTVGELPLEDMIAGRGMFESPGEQRIMQFPPTEITRGAVVPTKPGAFDMEDLIAGTGRFEMPRERRRPEPAVAGPTIPPEVITRTPTQTFPAEPVTAAPFMPEPTAGETQAFMRQLESAPIEGAPMSGGRGGWWAGTMQPPQTQTFPVDPVTVAPFQAGPTAGETEAFKRQLESAPVQRPPELMREMAREEVARTGIPSAQLAGGYDPPMPPSEQVAMTGIPSERMAGGYDPPLPPKSTLFGPEQMPPEREGRLTWSPPSIARLGQFGQELMGIAPEQQLSLERMREYAGLTPTRAEMAEAAEVTGLTPPGEPTMGDVPRAPTAAPPTAPTAAAPVPPEMSPQALNYALLSMLAQQQPQQTQPMDPQAAFSTVPGLTRR